MNQFLESLKSDLLDRRMRPFVALAALALVGAIAYIALAGSSESPAPAAVTHSAPVGLRSGVTITANTPEDALAETTSGGSSQHQGSTRDPFGGTFTAATETKSSGGSSSSSSGSTKSESSTSTSTPAGGSSPSSPSTQGGSSPTPSSPSGKHSEGKPRTVYVLDALFGEVPQGQEKAPQPATLDELKLLTPLPSKQVPLLVYRGVKQGGKNATFTVAGEAILSGPGACKPNPFHCETVTLKAGQSEDVGYLPTGSETVVTYELKIVSLTPSEASASKLASLWRGESAAGLEVLRAGNLLELPGLRESQVAGVLVPID